MDNVWIKYIDRTYQQIKDRVILSLQSLVPEITDHTENNIFVKMLSIWSGIAEMLGYYIDNMARESYISTARLLNSMLKLAKTFDYRVKLSYPAYVDITFSIENTHTSDIIIPQHTEVKASDYDYSFYTVEDVVIIAGELEATVGAKQISFITGVNIGTSDGSISQTFIIHNKNTADSSVSVYINGTAWQSVDTFAYSKHDDTHYLVTVDKDYNIVVVFGDDIKGKIPTNGMDIVIDYHETVGFQGNEIYSGIIDSVESVISLPPTVGTLTCINNKPSNGGASIEDIERLRANIPKSLRTLMRAVTRQDFIDIAELAPNVMKAQVHFECGYPIYVYVVPYGGGIATQTLLDSVVLWFEDKKIHTMVMDAKSSGIVLLSIDLDVVALSGYQNLAIQTKSIEAIKNLISWENQDIKGSMFVSDIYQAVENVQGVKQSIINNISLIPYARILQGTNTLSWVVLMKSAITDNKWTIKMSSTNTFQLFKNGLFVTNGVIGTAINFTEVEFTISGIYTVGDMWEFYTYKDVLRTSKLNLNEYSVIIADSVNVNVTGGV